MIPNTNAIQSKLCSGMERKCGGVFIDEWPFECSRIGYGQVGLHGDLGYEGKNVEVSGNDTSHAISAHGPSLLRFNLDGQYDVFHSRVAINDDAADCDTAADFMVIADEHVVGVAPNVVPGDSTRSITADIRGAREVQLVVNARRWGYCHSIWLNPQLSRVSSGSFDFRSDCLERAVIEPSDAASEAELCIATVGSPGFEDWIDDLFGSICANGQCPAAMFVVFFVGNSKQIENVVEKYHATLIRCRPRRPLGPGVKSILYSVGRFVRADKFICVDGDVLVLGDLRPIVSAIEASPLGSILACREGRWARTVADALERIYHAKRADLSKLLDGGERDEGEYDLVVNDGLFAGSRSAICALDETIRNMPNAARWIDEDAKCVWRNQFVMNLALAKMNCGRELAPEYNIQLNSQSVEFKEVNGALVAEWNGRNAHVVHFNGTGRGQHAGWRGRYAKISSPLTGLTGQRDQFDTFRSALRRWVGNGGIERLAWSFYGTSDGKGARVRDSLRFDLFAAIYSLIRSNGCARIVETGTARGVSAACLASAVADRESPIVVTFDPREYAARAALWGQLPRSVRRCIQSRRSDSIRGMAASLESGETFHAALLDSVHTHDHVLQEFKLASRLVCSGGLIMIHDPLLRSATIGAAIDDIIEMGYRVVTLWSAEEGTREDDLLGLAVVENRRYGGE